MSIREVEAIVTLMIDSESDGAAEDIATAALNEIVSDIQHIEVKG